MENNEKLDWKPEVGKTAWFMANGMIKQVLCIKDGKELMHNSFAAEVDGRNTWLRKSQLFPTPEAALASIKIYDLEGKEVVIPRADAFLAEKVLGLQMENDLLKKPVTTLAQAQMLLYEHGMMLDLSGLSPILIERGGAANGGKSDQREGGC